MIENKIYKVNSNHKLDKRDKAYSNHKPAEMQAHIEDKVVKNQDIYETQKNQDIKEHCVLTR